MAAWVLKIVMAWRFLLVIMTLLGQNAEEWTGFFGFLSCFGHGGVIFVVLDSGLVRPVCSLVFPSQKFGILIKI